MTSLHLQPYYSGPSLPHFIPPGPSNQSYSTGCTERYAPRVSRREAARDQAQRESTYVPEQREQCLDHHHGHGDVTAAVRFRADDGSAYRPDGKFGQASVVRRPICSQRSVQRTSRFEVSGSVRSSLVSLAPSLCILKHMRGTVVSQAGQAPSTGKCRLDYMQHRRGRSRRRSLSRRCPGSVRPAHLRHGAGTPPRPR